METAGVKLVAEGASQYLSDLSGADDATNDLSQSLSNAEGSGGGFASMLGNIGAMAGGVAAAGVAALGSAVVGALGVSFSYASEAAAGVDMLQARLGITADDAEALGGVAEQVFVNNFGESITEATDAVGELEQRLNLMASEGADALQHATESAFALRDAFDVDVSESAAAAQTLMNEFGITSEQAFDLVTYGMQSGLNSSDDFLDSIGEYSNLFADSGASAEEMFSLLQTGMAGGALGTDKAADLFKEFFIRIQDGSDTTATALAGLGLEELTTQIQSGAISASEAFPQIQQALLGINDPVLQAQLGVALFGTQFEDLGASAALGIDMSLTSLDEMSGAADSLNVQYDNLGSFFIGLWREMLVAIAPVGEALLALANESMPYIRAGFDQAKSAVEQFIAAGTEIVNALAPIVGPVIEQIANFFSRDLTVGVQQGSASFEAARNLIQNVMNAIAPIVEGVLSNIVVFWEEHGYEILAFVGTTWASIDQIIATTMDIINATIVPILTAIGKFIEEHGDDIQEVMEMAWSTIQKVIDTTIKTIQGILDTVLALIQGDWEGAWSSMQSTVSTVIDAIQGAVNDGVTSLSATWSAAMDGIQSVTDEVWTAIQTAVADAAQGVIDAVTGLATSAYDAGAAFIGSIRDGIMSTIGSLIADAKAALQELTDLLPGSEPKDHTSPLYGLGQRGAALVENFGEPVISGMQAMNDVVRASLGTTVATIAPAAPASTGTATPQAITTNLNYSPTYQSAPVSPIADFAAMRLFAQ